MVTLNPVDSPIGLSLGKGGKHSLLNNFFRPFSLRGAMLAVRRRLSGERRQRIGSKKDMKN
jgi:hypothetical protein